MAKITFTQDCDYRHASKCETAFKAGWSGTVKREIQQWAIKKGYGFEPEPVRELVDSDVLSDDIAVILFRDSSAASK